MKANAIYDVLNYKRYCVKQMKRNIKQLNWSTITINVASTALLTINVGSTALYQTKFWLHKNSDGNDTLMTYTVLFIDKQKKKVIDIWLRNKLSFNIITD